MRPVYGMIPSGGHRFSDQIRLQSGEQLQNDFTKQSNALLRLGIAENALKQSVDMLGVVAKVESSAEIVL